MTENYRNNNYQGSGGNRLRVHDAQRQEGGGFQQQESLAEKKFKELTLTVDYKYNPDWITKEADKKLIQFAEEAGKFMAGKDRKKEDQLTNSKIRSVYGEIKRIQMGDFDKEKSAFYLLKPKVAYALGRDERNNGLILFKRIFDLSSANVTNQKSYQNFCNFMEAILAYHKANGGKD
jgi:CRISPR-associated protein Csm2